jgi:hypothetical protein
MLEKLAIINVRHTGGSLLDHSVCERLEYRVETGTRLLKKFLLDFQCLRCKQRASQVLLAAWALAAVLDLSFPLPPVTC